RSRLPAGGPAGRAGAPAAGGNPGADHGAAAAHPRPRPGTDRPGLLALGHRHRARPHRRAGRAVLCRVAAVPRPAAAVRPGAAALEPGRGGGPAALRRLAEPAPPGLNAQSAQRPPSQAKGSGTSTPAAAIHIGCGIMAMLITTITNTTKPTVSAAPRLCRALTEPATKPPTRAPAAQAASTISSACVGRDSTSAVTATRSCQSMSAGIGWSQWPSDSTPKIASPAATRPSTMPSRVLIMAAFLPWKLPRASARRRGKQARRRRESATGLAGRSRLSRRALRLGAAVAAALAGLAAGAAAARGLLAGGTATGRAVIAHADGLAGLVALDGDHGQLGLEQALDLPQQLALVRRHQGHRLAAGPGAAGAADAVHVVLGDHG